MVVEPREKLVLNLPTLNSNESRPCHRKCKSTKTDTRSQGAAKQRFCSR